MRKLSLLALPCIFLSACTWNIVQTDTHGTASDVVDSDPKTEAQVSPQISVPASVISPVGAL